LRQFSFLSTKLPFKEGILGIPGAEAPRYSDIATNALELMYFQPAFVYGIEATEQDTLSENN